MATSLRMYATCQQLQAQARAHAAAASGLLGHAELHFQMPPSIAIATRGRLQGLRLQLALLDREFDELGIMLLCFTFGRVFVRPLISMVIILLDCLYCIIRKQLCIRKAVMLLDSY